MEELRMKMKEVLCLILAITLLSVPLAGCTGDDAHELQDVAASKLTERAEIIDDRFNQVVHMSGDTIRYMDEQEDLTEVSALVAVFAPVEQRTVGTYYEDGAASAYGYTLTTGRLERVLQGDASVGDTITITEECYISESQGVLCTLGGYVPMKPGESYLLFLLSYDDLYLGNPPDAFKGMYCPVDQEYGKYALTQEAMPASATTQEHLNAYEVNGYTDLEKYIEWYSYVRELYPELF